MRTRLPLVSVFLLVVGLILGRPLRPALKPIGKCSDCLNNLVDDKTKSEEANQTPNGLSNRYLLSRHVSLILLFRQTRRLSGVASPQQTNGPNEGEADHMISAGVEEGHVHSNRS